MVISRASADLWLIRATRRFRFRQRLPEAKGQNRFQPVRNWPQPWSGSSTCSSWWATTRQSWTRLSRVRGSIPGSSWGFPPGPGSGWCCRVLSRRAVVVVAAVAELAAARSDLTPEVAADILTKSSNPWRMRINKSFSARDKKDLLLNFKLNELFSLVLLKFEFSSLLLYDDVFLKKNPALF